MKSITEIRAQWCMQTSYCI